MERISSPSAKLGISNKDAPEQYTVLTAAYDNNTLKLSNVWALEMLIQGAK